MVCWFHNNLYPDLFKMIMDVEDPGFFLRKAPKLKEKMERVSKHRHFVTFYNIWRLIMHQIDILKDSLLVSSLLIMIGGPRTLIDFPRKFTSTVVITMAMTIVIPMLISSVGLLTEDPGVIYTPLDEILPVGTGKWRHYVRFQIIILSFFNSALLVNAYNENLAKRFKETGESLLERLKEGRRIKTQYVKYLRSELGLEIFYQVPIQIVLLFFAYTDTKTTGGLDIFFQESSWFGIPGKVILGLSSGWSVISSVLSHRKSIKDEKVYLSTKSQVCVCLWGLAGTLKRLIAMVGIFLPSLGLFDLLHHWQAEQIPFAIRRQKAVDGTLMDNDMLMLNLNITSEDVRWDQLDRTDWTEPHTPVFPGYTSYTGLSLRETFLSFLALLGVQFLTVLILKFIFVKSIRETKGKKLDILRHCLENMNIPVPWEDFDVQRGKIEEYKERRRRVHKEMFWVMISNLIFHLLMLLPLIYTGEN